MITPFYHRRHRSRPASPLERRRPLRVEPLEQRLLLSADLQLASVRGVAQVDGEDVVVQALYAVNPEADAQQQGLDILAGYGARPFQSANYSVYGWTWDQFFDLDTTNDFVTQYYNPGSSNTKPEPSSLNGLGAEALHNSQATWTNVGTSTFVFKDGGTTDRCPSLVKQCQGKQFLDGFNDVAWLRLEPNVYGVTWYNTSVRETDVALNTAISWSIGGDENSLDVETTFLHENGHVAGLRHSFAGTVMYYTYTGPQRVLHQDDMDGISFLYPTVAPDEAPTLSIASPFDGDSFTSGATIDFAGMATDAKDDDGVLTSSIVWTSNIDGPIGTGGSFSDILTDGAHVITASVTDSGDNTVTQSVSILVGQTPTAATIVSVDSISYVTQGGKNGDRNLTITVGPVTDDLGVIVRGADVRFWLYLDSSVWYHLTLTTGDDGTFSWTRNGVPAGTYTIEVESVTADGLIWDGITPPNSYTKSPSNSSRSNGSRGAELSIASAALSFSVTADSGRFGASQGDAVGSMQTSRSTIDHGHARSAATTRRAERPTFNRAAVDASMEAMAETRSVLRRLTAARRSESNEIHDIAASACFFDLSALVKRDAVNQRQSN